MPIKCLYGIIAVVGSIEVPKNISSVLEALPKTIPVLNSPENLEDCLGCKSQCDNYHGVENPSQMLSDLLKYFNEDIGKGDQESRPLPSRVEQFLKRYPHYHDNIVNGNGKLKSRNRHTEIPIPMIANFTDSGIKLNDISSDGRAVPQFDHERLGFGRDRSAFYAIDPRAVPVSEADADVLSRVEQENYSGQE